jgi:catechol 2,3-dioxygenase-like lactoylglutathione lyase family enzyme
MLNAIVAVTLVVPDVDAVARAYATRLDYEAIQRGEVSTELAESWGSPRIAGREFVLMRPASGEEVYLRLIASPGQATSEPLRHVGWNATEFLVEDPVQLQPKLADTEFRVIGPPRPLSMNPAVVAMQALGPANELLYFTRIPPGGSKFALGSATSFVDRVFIVVLGSRDIRASLDYYASVFGVPVTDPAPARIDVLREAWALPEDQQFPLAILRLPSRFLVEVDEYPAEAVARVVPEGGLPAGMAMVSFGVDSLEPFLGKLAHRAATDAAAPYSGRRSGVLIGPSGELIELIEKGE